MNLLVINGMHRSGTMLLSRLINAFPGTYIIKDGLRLPWYFLQIEAEKKIAYPRECYGNLSHIFDIHQEVKSVGRLKKMLSEELESLSLNQETHRKMYQVLHAFQNGITYHDAYIELFQTLQNDTDARWVGTKNTHMFHFRDAMLQAIPGMKWIDILRDPRGWFCSAKVSHHENIFRGAWFWNQAALSIARSRADHERYMAISFESLLLNSVATLQQICDFLGLGIAVSDEWIQALNLTTNDGNTWYPNPSFTRDGKEIHGDQNLRKSKDYKVLDPLPANRWKKKLTVFEKLAISTLTAPSRFLLAGRSGHRFCRF